MATSEEGGVSDSVDPSAMRCVRCRVLCREVAGFCEGRPLCRGCWEDWLLISNVPAHYLNVDPADMRPARTSSHDRRQR